MPRSGESSVRYIRPRARSGSVFAISTVTRGAPGASGKATAPRGRSGTGPGSAGHFCAGLALGGASAGVSTKQVGTGSTAELLALGEGGGDGVELVTAVPRGSAELAGSSTRLHADEQLSNVNRKTARIAAALPRRTGEVTSRR